MTHSKITRALTGSLLLLAGTILLLNNTNVLSFDFELENWWPLFVVAAGLLVLLNNMRSWIIAVFLIVLGSLYQLKTLEVIDFEPWAIIWPLAIIVIGASIIFKGSYSGMRVSRSERDDVTAIMAGTEIANSSKHFKQSNVTAIMGGAVLDLRGAEFEDNALVQVFGFWGGIEIVVPENVAIKNQLNNIMAGSEDKTKQVTNSKSPVLTIAGDVIMAGVSITNTPSGH